MPSLSILRVLPPHTPILMLQVQRTCHLLSNTTDPWCEATSFSWVAHATFLFLNGLLVMLQNPSQVIPRALMQSLSQPQAARAFSWCANVSASFTRTGAASLARGCILEDSNSLGTPLSHPLGVKVVRVTMFLMYFILRVSRSNPQKKILDFLCLSFLSYIRMLHFQNLSFLEKKKKDQFFFSPVIPFRQENLYPCRYLGEKPVVGVLNLSAPWHSRGLARMCQDTGWGLSPAPLGATLGTLHAHSTHARRN